MEDNKLLSTANENLLREIRKNKELFRTEPMKIYPWWFWPCTVRALLVTDGGLDFGTGDFGLSTFVSILQNDGRGYVRFELTLAHRSAFASDAQVQAGAAGIKRSIKGFKFDDTNHFSSNMYDEVFLFGINSGASLPNSELIAISQFMNGGGGVFATGDHGSLGNELCGNITRVRSMRNWNNSAGNVGMSDAARNDTNRPGHDAGSQFDDQSDDVPQPIQPKLYSSRWGAFWKETYPHPLLCSPNGRIMVLPDHPHEGECIEPSDISQTYLDGSPEYPMGIRPEVIAFSTVLAGSNAGGSKTATNAQRFGAISAYDGHRADIGRVVTDATWHHFVNVNLVGELGIPDSEIKGLGFLATAAGQAHFDQIKHYYINIGVWIARKTNHACFRKRTIWDLVYNHRVLEATMMEPNLRFEKIHASLIYAIGTHATDVLGKRASHCRKIQFILDIIRYPLPELIPTIDPWFPQPEEIQDPVVPWLDLNPLFAIAIGSGLLAVREEIGANLEKMDEKIADRMEQVFDEGVKRGIDIANDSFQRSFKNISRYIK